MASITNTVPASDDDNRRAGLTAGLAAYVLWGFLPLLFKQVEHVGSIGVVAERTFWSLIIVGIIVLLFGASKLPDLARGSGRALRIFKAETKGLMDDDDDEGTKTPEQRELESRQTDLAQRQAELDAEADRLRRGETA